MKLLSEKKTFIVGFNKKNQILEALLKKYVNRISRVTILTLSSVYEEAKKSSFADLKKVTEQTQKIFDHAFENLIKPLFYQTTEKFFYLSYALSAVTLNQFLANKKTYQNPKVKLELEEIETQLKAAWEKLKFKTLGNVVKALAFDLTEDEKRKMIFSVIGKPKKMKMFKQLRSKIQKQAEQKISLQDSNEFLFDFLTRKKIDDALEDYFTKVLDPQILFGRKDYIEYTIKGEEYLGIELERMFNEAFVIAARKGEIEAAKKAGVKDYMWNAILDNRTDECCEKRDGLLVSEIEELVKTKWKKDECDATVPPAHFNCRCALVPVFEDQDIIDKEVNDINDRLEDWLYS
ncbi:MAG: minor capsid protein [Thermoplasmatales archaeon]